MKKSKKLKAKVGSQPAAKAVAFNLGAQCPVGAEIQMVMGLDRLWPNLTREEALNSLFEGWASRFSEPKREERE